MRIDVTVTNDVPQAMVARLGRMERAVKTAVSGATVALKTAWRADVASKLGRRLSGAVRAEVYPKGDASLNAAGLVWTKSPEIIGAHERGAVVRSSSGFWLAVPTAKAGRGPRGKRITPAQWEQKTGRRLKFVYVNSRRSILIDDGSKGRGNVMVKNRKGVLSEPKTFRNRTVLIFNLIPQVKLPKRLNLKALGMTAGQGLPGRVRTALGAAI
jgi:hypothetical protein